MPRHSDSQPPTSAPGTDADAGVESPEYSSHELMAAHAEIRIRHEGTLYRLRRTTNGKLILTK